MDRSEILKKAETLLSDPALYEGENENGDLEWGGVEEYTHQVREFVKAVIVFLGQD